MSVSDPMLTRSRQPLVSDAFNALKDGKPAAIFAVLGIFLTLVIMAVMTWGVVALAMTALAFVPVVMIVLILITVGK